MFSYISIVGFIGIKLLLSIIGLLFSAVEISTSTLFRVFQQTGILIPRAPPPTYLRDKYTTPVHKMLYVLFNAHFQYAGGDESSSPIRKKSRGGADVPDSSSIIDNDSDYNSDSDEEEEDVPDLSVEIHFHLIETLLNHLNLMKKLKVKLSLRRVISEVHRHRIQSLIRLLTMVKRLLSLWLHVEKSSSLAHPLTV